MPTQRYLIVNADDFGQSHGITFTTLPPGLTELSCHPGYVTDLETMYRHERAAEVQVLCDPRIRAGLGAMGIELCSFRDRPAVIKRGVHGEGRSV